MSLYFLCVSLLWLLWQSLTTFIPFHRLRCWVAAMTMAPHSFFLLCWLLQTAISAFPEEAGPLNFIPTEGTAPLPFNHLLPRVPLSQVVMCEVWGRGLTFRVLNWGWGAGEGLGSQCGLWQSDRLSHTLVSRSGGVSSHSGMRLK